MYMDEDNYRDIIYTHGLSADEMVSPDTRLVFNAIHSLRLEEKPVEDALIIVRTGNIVGIQHLLGSIAARYDIYVANKAYIKECCDTLKRASYRKALTHLLEAGVREVNKPANDPHDIITRMVNKVNQIGINNSVQAVNATEHASALDKLLGVEPVNALATGVPWFDSLVGNIEDGQIVGIAGAYKARKTTILENLVLGTVLNGGSMVFCSREMPKDIIALRLITMMAVGWLQANGHWDTRINFPTGSAPIHHFSASQLRAAQKHYLRWAPLRVQAIQYALAKYRSFGDRLFILDSTPKNGGLTDALSVDRNINYYSGRYGIKRYAVDYLQLLAGSGLYEDNSAAVATLQNSASSRGATLFIAMQLNEQAIGGKGGYSPGIKGGGDAAQAVDYLVRSRYKETDSLEDDRVQLEMQLSRHGVGGGSTREQLLIHSRSGLLLDNQWINHLKEKPRAIDV